MRILKNTFKILCKSKLFFVLICMIILSGINGYNQFGKCENATILVHLEGVLFFPFYLFIANIFLSNEFMRYLRNSGICDVCYCTEKGYKGTHLMIGGCVLTICSILITISTLVGFMLCVIQNGVQLPDNRFVYHSILSIILNIFMMVELAMVIGIAFSAIENRIITYLLSFLCIFLVSPYFIQIADMVQLESDNSIVYRIAEFFNILPLVDEHYSSIEALGDSILPYRWLKILLFDSFILSALFISQRKFRKRLVLVMTICIGVGCCLCMNHNEVNMNFNPNNSRMCEQYEYWLSSASYRDSQKDEKPDYKIIRYDMELSLGINLNAKVSMTMNRFLEQYKMTLFHGYKVSNVYDEAGSKLEYIQKDDYILVKNSSTDNTKVTIEYSGCSAKYFSNIQGAYLPGYFTYYPRAGYIPVYDTDFASMCENFVDKKTEFNVKVNSLFQVYTNLAMKDGVYSGKCDGFTLLSGYYKEKELSNGNKVIYPYLMDFREEYCDDLEEVYEDDSEEQGNNLNKDKDPEEIFCDIMNECIENYEKKNTYIFIVPDVNQLGNSEIYGENQVFVHAGGIF